MQRSRNLRKNQTPYFWIYLFLAPTIILYSMYTIWPIISTVLTSFTNMRGFNSPRVRNVGLANYAELLKDPLFINSITVTFKFLVMVVPARFILSLFLALLLNWKKCVGKTAFRTVFFLPVLTTSAVIGVVFILILDPTFGPVNIILRNLGLTDLASKALLGNVSTVLATTGIVWVWKWLGNSLIYWIASLQSIPDEIYEASKIDGANVFQTFKAITMPLLIPFATIILVLTISDAIRVFNLMLTLTNGGPYYATETMEVFIYRHAFQATVPRMGYASAAATLFGLVFVVLMVVQNLGKKVFARGEKL